VIVGKLYAVTGGAGFIGSHICRRLVARGDQVRIIDNFSTGRKANIADLCAAYPARCEVFERDIRDLSALCRILQGVEAVFHQAAITSVQRSVEEPLETNSVNVEGTLKVFEAAREAHVKRVVFASSTSVYGDSEELPKVESMQPRPLSPYAASKYAGEVFGAVYSKTFLLPVVSLRYFNVFGPRQDPASEYAAVIPKFVTRMLRGLPPLVFGDGEQSRDFVYVDDVVSANLLATDGDSLGMAVNIAAGQRFSLNRLAEILNDILGMSLEPIHDAPRLGEVRHSQADISLARARLGFIPSVSFQEGLRRTVDWFRTQHAGTQAAGDFGV
jgi:UDP-glucose 4-epimerase